MIFCLQFSHDLLLSCVFVVFQDICDFQQCGMCDQQSLRSDCAYGQSDQSLCLSLEYSTAVKLLTEHHLKFLSLKGGCTGSSESTLVKIPHCWKSHVTAQMTFCPQFSHDPLLSCVFVVFQDIWDFKQCGMCNQQSLRSACAYAQSDQSLCLNILRALSNGLKIIWSS